jgi:phosphotransferase system enzyme I (PtsP)
MGCKRNNIPVSVCGEIAGRPLEALTLIALGYDSLSMPVTGIGPVKAAILKLNAQKLYRKNRAAYQHQYKAFKYPRDCS